MPDPETNPDVQETEAEVTPDTEALVTALGTVSSAINDLISKVDAVVTKLDTINTTLSNKLDSISTGLSSLSTIETSLESFSTISSSLESLGDISSHLESLSVIATNSSNLSFLNNISSNLTKMDDIHTDLDNIKSEITVTNTSSLDSLNFNFTEGVSSIKNAISVMDTNIVDKFSILLSQFNCEKSFNLFTDNSNGERNISYYLNSLATLIKKSSDNNAAAGDSEEESPEDEQDNPTEEEIAEYDRNIKDMSDSLFHTFRMFTYGVEKQDRLMFQSFDDFTNHQEGQSFDFTRYFVDHWNINGAKLTEYVLLGASRTSNISSSTIESGISRVTTWNDVKKVHTIVVIENVRSNTCRLFFPSQESITSLETEAFADEKKAVDHAVSKFQSILGDQYASVAVIPAKDIPQGILQTEYIEKAKLTTPTYEYN